MPSEQTCLQGVTSDGIHKTIGVFLKNTKNRQVFVRVDSSVGYFACAQYDVLFIPYRQHCRHFPRRRKRSLFYLSLRGSETTAVIRLNNGRSICRVLYSKGLPRHFVPRNDNKSIVRWDISLALNMTYNPLSAEKMRRGNNLAAVLLKLSDYTPK